MFGTALEINKVLQGKIYGDASLRFNGVSTDTRKIKRGELFIALAGPNYDAHNFIADAVKGGAVGVIVSRETQLPSKKIFAIKVSDTREALGRLAAYWREKVAPKVVAVTGSCGKTTTKELVYSILSKKGKTLKNHANLNNFYGLCQTLLQLRDEKYAVVEVGINNTNEMEELARIAKPDMGIVTNIGPVHLEGLKSLQQIYNEKSLLLDASKEAVFINADDRFLKGYRKEGVASYTFGKRGRFAFKDVVIRHLDGMVFTVFDRDEGGNYFYDVVFPYTGVALPTNVTGAIAIGRYMNICWEDILSGVKGVKLPGLRMERLKVGSCDIILDAYNANPASVNQALETFRLLEGKRKTVILGDMKELGRFSKLYHKVLGKKLLKYPFNYVILVGKEIEETYCLLKQNNRKNVKYFQNVDELKPHFNSLIAKSDVMLLKGSRVIALEKVVQGEINAL
ncbi:MAG: UDP-N-acetylmuramoyl-tripeptide--D-alanyl-D-alanine ligase [bacterium]